MTADAAARKLGFAEDHPLRIQAGLLYVLQKATDDGNVFLPEEELLDQACQQLAVDRDLARQAVLALEQEERVVRESLDELPGRLPAVFREDGEEAEYFYVAEDDDDEDSDDEFDFGITKEGVAEVTGDMNAIYKDGIAVAAELKGAFDDIKSALDFGSVLKK